MSAAGVIIGLVLSAIILMFLSAAFYYGFAFIKEEENASQKREFIFKQVIVGILILGLIRLIFLFIKNFP